MENEFQEIGIYIHFPFCKRICSYCDFVVDDKLFLVDSYINHLILDIKNTSKKYFDSSKYKVKTIYFGGGTPSIMSPQQLSLIVEALHINFNLSDVVELSIESNPNSINYEKLLDYKSLGINRISIGVQSFIKRDLGLLKRSHSPNNAIQAIESAQRVNFNSINLDLIFSIPNQTEENWLFNLTSAANLGTDHISCYNLTYEKGTPLFNKLMTGEVIKHSDDFDSNVYLSTSEFLEKHNFLHYEVSNYAKKGKECIHNLMIWENKEYLGFGVGAHWKIDKIRYENTKDMKSYFESCKIGEINKNIRRLESKEIIEEYIILGLRSQGIDVDYLERILEMSLKLGENLIFNRLISEKYITFDKINIKLTNIGYLYADSISYELLKIFKLI